MISIDIDGPSTMLSSICESIVITQGSIYTNVNPKPPSEKSIIQSVSDLSSHLTSYQGEMYLARNFHSSRNDKIEVINSWHDHTVINGSSNSWCSPFKSTKTLQSSTDTIPRCYASSDNIEHDFLDSNRQENSSRDVALSPVFLTSKPNYHSASTSPLPFLETVDRSCQYSPPIEHDQSLQCFFETKTCHTQVASYEIPGLLKTQDAIQTNNNSHIRTMSTYPTILERSADSGILVDDNYRKKSNLALQVDMKSSSSDSEDTSEIRARSIIRPTPSHNGNLYENRTRVDSNSSTPTNDIEQEILQLRRERTHILDLLSLNWNRSNIWVELTEAKLNYIIGETGKFDCCELLIFFLLLI